MNYETVPRDLKVSIKSYVDFKLWTKQMILLLGPLKYDPGKTW